MRVRRSRDAAVFIFIIGPPTGFLVLHIVCLPLVLALFWALATATAALTRAVAAAIFAHFYKRRAAAQSR